MKTNDTKQTAENALKAEGDSVETVVMREQINSLSIDAKIWLAKTCERFADGEGYDEDESSITECLVCNLVTRGRGKTIEVSGEVMELVYTDNYIDVEKLESVSFSA